MEKVLNNDIRKITKSMDMVEKWVEEHNYKGYEPFDGLSSFFKPLTFGNTFLERILQQTVRQSPFNLRPLLGIKPLDSTKGRGYMAQGYINNWKITGKEEKKDKAIECLNWLDKNKSPFYSNHSWGNHFPVSFRGGHEPSLEPIIVWTSIIGHAFLDSYESFGIKRHIDVAQSAIDFILKDLPREETKTGVCISYITSKQRSIHNSNMLGAAFLARFSKITGNKESLDLAKEAMQYSCSRQLPDGSWYYGEANHYHWIDNFHSGYNLDSLKCFMENTDENIYMDKIIKGMDFYRNNFFEENGRPKYYHNRTYPVDIQCAAQAIETLSHFADHDKRNLELGLKVAYWTIDNMQHKSGYFYYRQLPLKKIKIPMLHWGQATMYKALSLLLLKIKHK